MKGNQEPGKRNGFRFWDVHRNRLLERPEQYMDMGVGRWLSKSRNIHSVLKNAVCCSVAISCILLVSGCQKETPAPQTAPVAKKETPRPPDVTPAAEVKEEKEEETAIAAKQQRNPFKSFIVKAVEKIKVVVPKTPLQKYELDQLRLVAVIWGIDIPMAMVETPEGKGYTVRKGDLIGNRDGKIKSIDKDRVVVEEKSIEVDGRVTTTEYMIKLPLPREEEELR